MSLPSSPILILDSVASCRAWRRKALSEAKSVGFVPTMGALHEGHLSLVRRSLAENDLTIVSIFVNPAQFAPHEDLATYPRTLPRDLELLAAQELHVTNTVRKPSAVFLPGVRDMYPSGISQDVESQNGTFVEVKGYSHQMEGKSRPTFFRGVATVVTKLFNLVQPTNAYFGQKDIQQALLLRKLCSDLLFTYPDMDHLHIVPTARDPVDGLALSSRNAYLSADERLFAGTLYQALQCAESTWSQGGTKEQSVSAAVTIIERGREQATLKGVTVELDYIEMNHSDTFGILDGEARKDSESLERTPVILSGALWVGKTRLIDNIILGGHGTMVN
ncbi:Pantoate-beta-alanine ligase [Pisolithus orientalis]|uniref:Pantoate-beta-alanine ligase n=1 Tax=Pisolithus orientalis TaxID=936130 RepID=UPI0022249547|nr:Pantoate-beta-alanine ligase [Pisolithus orientalis]KAI6006725.1 Pantoate-beta-alanine ligase [Pisolithus orientalis]